MIQVSILQFQGRRVVTSYCRMRQSAELRIAVKPPDFLNPGLHVGNRLLGGVRTWIHLDFHTLAVREFGVIFQPNFQSGFGFCRVVGFTDKGAEIEPTVVENTLRLNLPALTPFPRIGFAPQFSLLCDGVRV